MGDVVATLWALITFVGFVVSLQIPKAEELARVFEREVNAASRERAYQWALFVRCAPTVVVMVVIAVAMTYGISSHWTSRSLSSLEFFLLSLPVVAQILFAIIVPLLVRSVPKIRTLLPVSVPDHGSRASTKGIRPEVAVRFKNRTRHPLSIVWIDFDGNLDETERDFRVASQGDFLIYTFDSHEWLVRTEVGQEIAVFSAASLSVAEISEAMLSSDTKKTDHRGD